MDDNEEPETEVLLPGAGYQLREERGASRGPLKHERSLPLPLRVKSGQIKDDVLVLETAHEVVTVPWADVRMVALGVIEEKVEMEATSYNLEKMMGGMSRMIKGGGGRDESRITSTRETNLVDLYVQGRLEPFRIDSAHVNYRSMLQGDMSYISFQNFFRLVHRLAQKATEAHFNEPLSHFLARRRDRVHKFAAVYDFELDTQNRMQSMDDQPGWGDLSFERTSWAEEWVED